MSKPTISFNRNNNGAVCGMISIPYHDDDASGALQVSGFGINPLAALRKAAEVATRVLNDPEMQMLIPPQAAIVIKTARALTQLDKGDLLNVAKDDDTAPSAKKLASVLGELTIGARKKPEGRGWKRNRKYGGKGAAYRDRRAAANRQLPEVDQYGNQLDQYGNPVDEYGQPIPMDPNYQGYNPYAQQPLPGYDQYGGGYGGYPPPPYAQPYYGQPAYGQQPYPIPDPYAQMYPPGSPQGADSYFDDHHQQFAEQAWGSNAFAEQDYGDADYMQDVGAEAWDGQGCEPYCDPTEG